MFNSNLASSDLHELKQCLRTYATINKRDVVERLFRTGVVKPFMEKVRNARREDGGRRGEKKESP